MIARVLTLAGGLSGAVGLSQFPEFSQQYVQRLGGAVDELRLFVAEFDADAAKVGATRDEALEQLTSAGALGVVRSETMRRTIERLHRLEQALANLDDAGPFTRVYFVSQFNDQDIAEAAWNEFKPAVPVTTEGAIFSGVGLIGGSLFVSFLLGFLGLLFRRRNVA